MKIKNIHKLKLPYQFKVKGLNRVLNRVTKRLENRVIRKNKIKGSICPGTNTTPVIVSLTTYPARTQKVQWTLKSLLNQTATIDRLILWLAGEQYPQEIIPDEIKQYIPYGLEVRFCDDLRSHKKYYYTMLENPDVIVITVDDDVIYPEDTVEKLIRAHEKFPNAVICNQGRLIRIVNGDFAQYRKWTVNIPSSLNTPGYLVLPVGEGGVLYPPDSVDSEVFNKEGIFSSALTADDLWLKFMSVKKGTKAVTSSKTQRAPSEVSAKESSDTALNKQNVSGGQNDNVINNLKKQYGDVLQRLLAEADKTTT